MPDDPSPNEAVTEAAPGDSMDAVIEVYKRDVDRTLLRENLKLTVKERLLKAMRMHRSVDDWRGAGAQAGANRGARGMP